MDAAPVQPAGGVPLEPGKVIDTRRVHRLPLAKLFGIVLRETMPEVILILNQCLVKCSFAPDAADVVAAHIISKKLF